MYDCVQASLEQQECGNSHMGLANGADSSAGGLAASPGLQNLTGEYNCFLNVVVQCLWHCRAFHKGFMGLPLPVVQVCSIHAQLHVHRYPSVRPQLHMQWGSDVKGRIMQGKACTYVLYIYQCESWRVIRSLNACFMRLPYGRACPT